jgi:hypothetical protein
MIIGSKLVLGKISPQITRLLQITLILLNRSSKELTRLKILFDL